MESLFLGHLRVYNICIVWAPGAGGPGTSTGRQRGPRFGAVCVTGRSAEGPACTDGAGSWRRGVPAHEAASSGGRGTWSPAARAGSPAPSCEGSTRDLRLAGTGANEPRVPGCEQIKNVKKCPASAPGVCTLLLVISPLTR